jgi:hypothetical protein
MGAKGVLGSVAGAFGKAGSTAFAQGAISAVSSNLVNQVTQRVAGAETSFSWRSIAISTVSSGIANSVASPLTKAMGFSLAKESGQMARDLTAGFTGGLVSAHLHRRFGSGDEVDMSAITADAFGSMLASRLTGQHRLAAEDVALQDTGPMLPGANTNAMSHEALMAWQTAGQSPNPYADFAAGGQYSTAGRYAADPFAGFRGGTGTAPSLSVATGARYANNPDYRFIENLGGYVAKDAWSQFTTGVDEWSGYFSQRHPNRVPAITGFIEAFGPGRSDEAYLAYNREVAQPFTAEQRAVHADPLMAAMLQYQFNQKTEGLLGIPAPFTVKGYRDFSRSLGAADRQATQGAFVGGLKSLVDGAAELVQFAGDRSNPMAGMKYLTGQYPVPFGPPQNSDEAFGYMAAPLAMSALPGGAIRTAGLLRGARPGFTAAEMIAAAPYRPVRGLAVAGERGAFASYGTAIRQTGARLALDPTSMRSWDVVEDAYDVIRADASDIVSIAQNTGWSESRIARIKDHVFFKEHQLDTGLRRFDADPDILNSWSRLTRGDFVQSDVDLLRHEIFESRFNGIFKTDYRQAHEAALRAGRNWTPG